jgi:hypothetical protein
MISLFENREELEKLLTDYTSKCAELEAAQNEFLVNYLTYWTPTAKNEELVLKRLPLLRLSWNGRSWSETMRKDLLAKVQISSSCIPEVAGHCSSLQNKNDSHHSPTHTATDVLRAEKPSLS